MVHPYQRKPKHGMTGQQLLEQLKQTVEVLNQIIKAGLDEPFVDMQKPIPSEVYHDYQQFSEAFENLQMHCKNVDTPRGAEWIAEYGVNQI